MRDGAFPDGVPQVRTVGRGLLVFAGPEERRAALSRSLYAYARCNETAPGDFRIAGVNELVDRSIDRVGNRLKKSPEPNAIEASFRIRQEGEGRKRLPAVDSQDFSAFGLIDNDVIGRIGRLDAHDLLRIHVHGDDVGLGQAVLIQIVQPVLFDEASGLLRVFADVRQRHVPVDAGPDPVLDLVRIDIEILRDARAAMQGLGVVVDRQPQARHEVGA